MDLNEALKATDRSRKTRKSDSKKAARVEGKKEARTFGEELEAALVKAMVDEGVFDWFKRKPASPTTPSPAPKMAAKVKKPKDSPHYKTDHHYGHGDIDPATIPVFKPSWKTAK